jgi:oxygen-dependent protoporphyrinogen oxidase
LVDSLAWRLPETAIRLNSPVRQLICDETSKIWQITVDKNELLPADAVILATPAFQTGAIISAIGKEAAGELKKISYTSTATVSLAYRREDFPRALDSFGFVVPAVEHRKIMACTFSSLKYPGRAPDDRILLRAFVGGALQPELFGDGDAIMEQNVREELASLLGVRARPIFTRIWRHSNSMPQYHIGHEGRVKRIKASLSSLPTLALAGSAYHGVGISDCVRTGETAAEKLLGFFQSNP